MRTMTLIFVPFQTQFFFSEMHFRNLMMIRHHVIHATKYDDYLPGKHLMARQIETLSW